MKRNLAAIAFVPALSMLSAVSLVSANAQADDTISQPGNHPKYSVEVEPHAIFGWDAFSRGYGVGARFSFPLMPNGPISSINNNFAIGVGGELLISGHYRDYNAGTLFLLVPVDLQWNFYVASHWSVFGEAGAYLFHGFYDCGAGIDCSVTGARPALGIGGRYHATDKVALTLRLGFPSVTFGGSFYL